jgi:uncharacterized protein YbaR (Trm112 family)
MTDESKNANLGNLKQWVEDLACPVCSSGLRFEPTAVVCSGCGRTYPVADGIPVLIAQRASEPSKN